MSRVQISTSEALYHGRWMRDNGAVLMHAVRYA